LGPVILFTTTMGICSKLSALENSPVTMKKVITVFAVAFSRFPEIPSYDIGNDPFRGLHVLEIFITEFGDQEFFFYSYPVAVGTTGYHQDNEDRSP
jgi:hypothetical protein